MDQNNIPRYQIRLRGVLDPKWADWFDGFAITYSEGDSLLTGPVVDQPALHGMLAKVRDLGMPLLSLTIINEKKEKVSTGTGCPPNFARLVYRMQPV